MRNEAPVIAWADWAERTNAATRACMGVVIGPELPAYSPPPDKFQRTRKWAQEHLSHLMSDEEAAAHVVADVERVRALGGRPRDEYEGLSWSFAAACRAADAEFLVKQKDPAQLRRWLGRHNAAEREAILRHLEQKKMGGG